MAWSVPLTAVSNSPLTAAAWNASVRDNLLETAPAKFTGAGQLFVSTGANAGAARTPASATVATNESTNSTTYTNLVTAGPQVVSTTGTSALCFWQAQMGNSTSGSNAFMSVAVSGASTVAASDTFSSRYQSYGSNARHRSAAAHLFTGLTAGSNTFTAQYRVDGGSGAFIDRSLIVIPL
ncbi:hypothetical protein ABZ949_02270 [Micromonospora tulbaghiae]|uniref:hypothetical protein n=1 Tax=Micromonospora tulbaghiae TaxID=479978 RepID=UPI0033E6A2A3